MGRGDVLLFVTYRVLAGYICPRHVCISLLIVSCQTYCFVWHHW